MEPGDDDTIRLQRGGFRASVRPGLGGSLTGFWHAAGGHAPVAVLRPTPAGATSPLQAASFPLVPWCNRIEHGAFDWRGRTVRLRANHPGDAFPLHGYGWYARWRTVDVGAASVVLEWADAGGEWPWPYAARARYALEDDGLVVELAVENRADEPMPAGLGHHPYFPRTERTRVRARLPVLWEPDARLIPRGPVPNPLAAEFEAGCRIAGVRLDSGYTGWDGVATIEQPDDGLRVDLLGADGDAFHLYVPDAPFFCAEAVTNQPNALNDPRAAAPMVTLAPGATLRYAMRLRVTATAAEA
jgi:aldose 1-epimerase